ncbi:MAG: DinB family protein [Chloroflexi bacterium]|nr:DinB family protein [Chloroflexota bacterium]
MATNRPVMAAFALDALDDLARSLEGIDKVEADEHLPGFSPVSWTVAHVAQHIDSWVNNILAGHPRNGYFAGDPFAKGATGEGAEWKTVSPVLQEVLGKARAFLEKVTGAELARAEIYQGSMQPIRGKLVTGNYRLARLTAHIYYHIGEIVTIRSAKGHKVGDFPGLLPMSVETKDKE